MAAAAIIARLLQAGTRQGQKAAAALLRMLKKSNPATLERNVYKEYGNLGRKALSKDMLGPLSKFRAPNTRNINMERAFPEKLKDPSFLGKPATRGKPKEFYIKATERGIAKERAMALDRLRKAASHGSPKGIKNTPGGMKATEKEIFIPTVGFVKTGGMKATKKGFEYRDATPNLGDITMRAPRRGLKELRSLERTAERSYNFPRKDFKPTSFKQFKRGTKRKNARKLAELRRYVDFLSRGGAG